MNLWFNSLIFYTKIFFLSEGQNFNPFSCLIALQFQWGPEWQPKNELLDSLT